MIAATDNPITDMITEVKATSDYTNRVGEVQAFNAANRWKKRGMAVVPMRYGHNLALFGGMKYNCLINVFAADGTVSIAHAGIEMGQGLNTKVAQCVAYELGIDISLIKIKPVTLVANPNIATTGGSVGSESVCFAAIESCKILNERLAPIREANPEATWPELIKEANDANVDLCARYM